jgi:hypothetical protein
MESARFSPQNGHNGHMVSTDLKMQMDRQAGLDFCVSINEQPL